MYNSQYNTEKKKKSESNTIWNQHYYVSKTSIRKREWYWDKGIEMVQKFTYKGPLKVQSQSSEKESQSFQKSLP